MSGRLIKPKIDRIFSSKITQLVTDLSSRNEVFAVRELTNQCPNCIYDSTNKASSGKYKTGGPQPFTGKVCPVCDNKGKTVETKKTKLTATVKFGKADTATPITAYGLLPIGTARIKGVIAQQQVFLKADYFLIDKVRYDKLNVDAPSRGLQTKVIVEQYVRVNK